MQLLTDNMEEKKEHYDLIFRKHLDNSSCTYSLSPVPDHLGHLILNFIVVLELSILLNVMEVSSTCLILYG